MVLKYWENIIGESVFDKYNRFLNDVMTDRVEAYVHSDHLIIGEEVLLNGEPMYIKLLPRENELTLDMLMYNHDITSKELFTCDPRFFIIKHDSSELLVNHILTFNACLPNNINDDDTLALAYAAHRLINDLEVMVER